MFYKLEGKTPFPCLAYELKTQRVAYTELPNKIVVSTVFLGLEHGFDERGRPILFETPPFNSLDGSLDDHMERYATWEDAEAGHNRIVAQLSQ